MSTRRVWAGRGPHGIPAYPRQDADIGPWDDLFLGAALRSAWTLRGLTGADVSVSSDRATLTIDGQGDAMYIQPGAGNIGSSTDCDIYMRCSGNNVPGRMAGIALLDSSGNGLGFSPYDDSKTYLWNITAYNYVSTGPTTNDRPILPGDYWLHVRKRGSSHTGRWATHDSNKTYAEQNYGSFTTALTRTDAFDRVGFDAPWTTGSGTIAIEEFRYRKA